MKTSMVLTSLALLLPISATAAELLSRSGDFDEENSNETQRFDFEIRDPDQVPVLETEVELTQGKAGVRVIAPDGEKVFDASTGGWMRIGGKTLAKSERTGVYHVEVVPEDAIGTWTVRIATTSVSRDAVLLLIPAVGMVAVGVCAVLLWRLLSGVQWRWFWVGAAVWTVGVIGKFAFAIPLNEPILGGLKQALPHDIYLTVGSLYIGLLTGVFEIGVTLVAALIWKGMTKDAGRGLAVGVGSGAFEAILLGLGAGIAVTAAILVGGEIREAILGASATNPTPLLWLVGPVERLICVLCHTSSRALVLLGVARGRWGWPFFWGFLIMTAIDSVAGYVHLTGILGKTSVWWIELAIAPAAVVSIPVLFWCVRNWPDTAEATPEAEQPTSSSEEESEKP